MSTRKFMRFEILAVSRHSKARVGRIHTPHGVVDTPGFVAVATNGALKHLDFPTADALGCQLVFCNTAHFLVNSGPDLVHEAGGLHEFLRRRNRPLITDSSGFQVFSWGDLVKKVTTKDGITFRSYKDGKYIQVSPETSIRAQVKLGADIILVLDELLGYENATKEVTATSMERSHIWAERSWLEFDRLKSTSKTEQGLYGIVHGGFFPDLRKQSAEFLVERNPNFAGFALGGSLGIGPTQDEAKLALATGVDALPVDKPKHLLGIGDINSLRLAIPLGIDTFDSSFPTKLARHGTVVLGDGSYLTLRKSMHAKRFNEPLDPTCTCSTCTLYSVAYLHHLLKTHEPVLPTLLCIHNLAQIHAMMAQTRQDIIHGRL